MSNLTELKQAIEGLPEASDEYYGYVRLDNVLSLLSEVTLADILAPLGAELEKLADKYDWGLDVSGVMDEVLEVFDKFSKGELAE